jgi:hypothetical protein
MIDLLPIRAIIDYVHREDRALLGSNPSARWAVRRWTGASAHSLMLRSPLLPSLDAKRDKPTVHNQSTLTPHSYPSGRTYVYISAS